MYQSLRLTPISVNTEGLSHGIKVLDPAPSINLETGVRVEISEGNIESELNIYISIIIVKDTSTIKNQKLIIHGYNQDSNIFIIIPKVDKCVLNSVIIADHCLSLSSHI